MPVCSWCQAEVSQDDVARDAPCARCGRRAPEAQAVGEPAAPALELELDLPAPGPPRGGPSAPALDLPPPERSALPRSPHAELAKQLAGTGDALEVDVVRPKVAPPPDSIASDVDRYEVLALADYGPEPRSWLQTIPYAFRVKRRQRELRKALAGVRAALTEAEARRDERWIELGELLRPLVATDPALRRFERTLEAAERTRGTREAGLAEADSAFQARVATIDRQLAELEAPLAKARAEHEARRAEAAASEGLRQQHEARRKRVDIDVRAAQAVLQSPQSTAEQRRGAEARIAAATQERDVRAREEAIASTAAQQSQALAGAAGRALQANEERHAALRAARREIEREFARQGEIRSEGLEVASRELRQALLELGKSAASTDVAVPGADIKRKGIADGEAAVRRQQVALERHLRALDAANPEAVRRGAILVGLLAVLLVGGFVAWRALRTNPYLDAPPPPPAVQAPR